MANYGYPYSIFDQNKLIQYMENRVDPIQQHHDDQQKNIRDIRKAIADYCNAARKVSPDYQKQAMDACMEEIAIQILNNR